MVDTLSARLPDRRARLPVAALLVMVCGAAAGDVATTSTLSPQQVATFATDIRPAMDLLLAPVDRVFTNGFE